MPTTTAAASPAAVIPAACLQVQPVARKRCFHENGGFVHVCPFLGMKEISNKKRKGLMAEIWRDNFFLSKNWGKCGLGAGNSAGSDI